MNSTPSTSLLSMCRTALPPPPPTPITLITALCCTLSTSSNIPLLLRAVFSQVPADYFLEIPSYVRRYSEMPGKPGFHPLKEGGRIFSPESGSPSQVHLAETMNQQSHAGGVNRVVDNFRHARHCLRRRKPYRHVENLFGQLHHPFHGG